MEGKIILRYVLYNVANEKYLGKDGFLTIDVEKAMKIEDETKAKGMIEYLGGKCLWKVKKCKISYEVDDI